MKLFFAIYLFIIFILNTNEYSQTYWVNQSSPTNQKLWKCRFLDSLYGWAAGDSGTIIRTTNGGFSWLLLNTGIYSFTIDDITFPNVNYGWAVCLDSVYRTIVLKTTNGGNSWTKSYFPDSSMIFKTIFFINQNTGYISGYSGRIFKTTSGGANWFECGYDSLSCLIFFPKEDIYFVDSLNGFSCGGVLDLQGMVLKTTNAGATWVSLCLSPEPLRALLHKEGNMVYAMGGDFDLGSMYVVSNDFGISWQYDTVGCFGNATGFSFRTPKEVWAALSFYQRFAVNLDSMKPGSRWQCIEAPLETEVNDLIFLSPTNGWAFGSHGRIFKYNSAVIGLSEINTNISISNILYQNYPNPFNPATTIKYYIHAGTDVRITIYDVTGKEVFSINEGFKQAGYYELQINFFNLPSAVYFYQLKTNQGIQSKKLILLK
jgi:photosystem II stability/assembly factor-like uncharacterized protein